MSRAKKQRAPVVDPSGSLGENEHMKGERGNVGIFILIHLLVAILVGFFLWSIFPEPWREFLRNGPWGVVVVVLTGFIIVVSIVRGELARREHKRAHDRVAKVFREVTDPTLQKRAALWLVDHDRDHPERLADAGPGLADVLLRILKSDTEKLDRTKAANGLGVLGDPRAIVPLLAATKDEYGFVRAEAALALGKLKAKQAEKRLREMVEDDWDANARGRAREALERIAG
jgi:F0F1-type ATP synthase assembly protein I